MTQQIEVDLVTKDKKRDSRLFAWRGIQGTKDARTTQIQHDNFF